MWFRGVAASMGLCLNLGAVLEGHPDILFAVNGDVAHHRQPVSFPELATEEWLARCSSPLGMDDEGNLFPIE